MTVLMIRRYFACALVILIASVLSTVAMAQSFPALTGRVVDGADLLSPAEEADLTTRLAALEGQSQRQVVVVTLPSLGGYAIEDYGYQLGRHWGIGSKERDDGALLIVAPNDRRVRIEVGYGLEPVLTDALSSLIISRNILPAFRDGQYAAGIMSGADAIIHQLTLPEEDARKIAEAARTQKESDRTPNYIFWIFFFMVFILPSILPIFGIKGRRHRGTRIFGPGIGGFGSRSGGRSGGFRGGGFGGGGGGFGGGGSSGSW